MQRLKQERIMQVLAQQRLEQQVQALESRVLNSAQFPKWIIVPDVGVFMDALHLVKQWLAFPLVLVIVTLQGFIS
jgi:hypothetical protein